MRVINQNAKTLLEDVHIARAYGQNVKLYGIKGSLKDPWFEFVINVDLKEVENGFDYQKRVDEYTTSCQYGVEENLLFGIGSVYTARVFKEKPEAFDRIFDSYEELVGFAEANLSSLLSLAAMVNNDLLKEKMFSSTKTGIITSSDDLRMIIGVIWSVIVHDLDLIKFDSHDLFEAIEERIVGVTPEELTEIVIGFDYTLNDGRKYSLHYLTESEEYIETDFQSPKEGVRQPLSHVIKYKVFEDLFFGEEK